LAELAIDRADPGIAPSLELALCRLLRHNIVSGRLPPGTVLNEHSLSQDLSVSRAPTGRALDQLASEGLILRNEGRGFRIAGTASVASAGPPRLDLPADMIDVIRGRAGWERLWDQVEGDLATCMPFARFKIVELTMAEHYGVSRSITRDILGRLQARGMIERSGRSQCFLPELTSTLMHHLYEVRRLLEPVALLHAAEHLDRDRLDVMRTALVEAAARYPDVSGAELASLEHDLHQTCLEPCPNKPLLAALRQHQPMTLATNRLVHVYLGMPEAEPFLAEHRLVIDLLIAGTADAAAAALEAHLRSAVQKQRARFAELKAHHRPVVPPYLQRVAS
jgi:DNA-binding GntR family transcriptional regulator